MLWPAYRVFFHNVLLYRTLKMLRLKGKWINYYILTYEANERLLCRDYIKPARLSFEEAQAQLISSNVILDLPFECQTGYTHRLIEALANGKKVITTNQRIRAEHFYNPDQIKIVDSRKAVVDMQWIKEEKKFEVDGYLKRLELSDWLNSIFNARVA